VKNVGELMAELGFRADGSDDVKKAFIINLIRAAAASDAARGKPMEPAIDLPVAENKTEPEQLSFDLGPAPSEALHSLETLRRMRKSPVRRTS
jgi:hypothetical protein